MTGDPRGPRDDDDGIAHPPTPDGYFNHPEGYGNVQFKVNGRWVDHEEWLVHLEEKRRRTEKGDLRIISNGTAENPYRAL